MSTITKKTLFVFFISILFAYCHISMHSYGKKSPADEAPGTGQAEREIKLRNENVNKICVFFS